jgi:hypothetical protein
METTTAMTRHKMRSFHDVTKHIGETRRPKQQKVMQEAQDYAVLQTDETSDLNYFVMSVPKNLSRNEKIQRIAILANKVTDVEESDVICMAMWIPSDTRNAKACTQC